MSTEWLWCYDCEDVDCEECGHGFYSHGEDDTACPCCGSEECEP